MAQLVPREVVSIQKLDSVTILEEEREKIFAEFWQNTNWDQRRTFVLNRVKKVPTKQSYVQDENRSSCRKYSLQYVNCQIVPPVCKRMFLNALAIGEKIVRLWISAGGAASSDCRVKCRLPLARTQQIEWKNNLEKFLDQLAKMPSHYARANTDKLCIEPFVTTLKTNCMEFIVMNAS